MILAAGVREFRLEEKIFASNESVCDRLRNGRSDSRFEIVTPLIRGVDSPKACLNGEPRQPFGLIFLPCCAVEETHPAILLRVAPAQGKMV